MKRRGFLGLAGAFAATSAAAVQHKSSASLVDPVGCRHVWVVEWTSTQMSDAIRAGGLFPDPRPKCKYCGSELYSLSIDWGSSAQRTYENWVQKDGTSWNARHFPNMGMKPVDQVMDETGQIWWRVRY